MRCPGQACVNAQGSYNCVSCKPGFSMINGQCSGKIPLPLCVLGYTCVPVILFFHPSIHPSISTSIYSAFEIGNYLFSNLLSFPTDIDECRQTPSPCTTGHCENTQGSYSCACLTGYRLHGDTCTDADECADPSQCPGQECVNSQGSYKCVSCKPGFGLVNRRCTGRTQHGLYQHQYIGAMADSSSPSFLCRC